MAGRRLPGGDIIFVTNTFQGENCFRVGGKDDKEVGKPFQLGRMQQYQSIDVISDDKILVCEFNRVVGYDLKADRDKAKEVWKFDVSGATSCRRLPNGNTLITQVNFAPNGRVIEVDPERRCRVGVHLAGRAAPRTGVPPLNRQGDKTTALSPCLS